jgi:hypothetical protein
LLFLFASFFARGLPKCFHLDRDYVGCGHNGVAFTMLNTVSLVRMRVLFKCLVECSEFFFQPC